MWVGRAVRAAVAATLAWLLVQPFGGLADQYPWYPPLGALVAVTTTVAGSVRETWRIAFTMVLGAGLAVAALPLPEVVGILLVVGLGSWISGWSRLGSVGSWVPITGLFVLVFGGDHPWSYIAAYVGFTTFGATVGLVVSAVFPPMPLDAARTAMDRLRQTLCDQLEVLAAGLDATELPSRQQWREHSRAIDPDLHKMRKVVSLAEESRKANWRANRHRAVADRREGQARALDALAFLVEDLSWMLTDSESAGQDEVALGPRIRPLTAEVLSDLATVLHSHDDWQVDDHAWQDADAALARLVAGIHQVREQTGDDMVAASGVVSTVRRTLDTLR